jgi:hypothetical protein
MGYTVNGLPANTGYSLEFVGANGTSFIALWNEDWSGASAQVTVTLRSSATTVALYDVLQSATPTQTLQNVTSVPVTLGLHPIILKVN